jgi:hypothetical protein
MKHFPFLLVVHLFSLGLVHAQSPDAGYIKTVFGTPEIFQAIIGADKVSACVLKTPPKKQSGVPFSYRANEYLTGPEKELPADLLGKLREVLSDSAAMYDPEAEELAGGTITYDLRYTFHTPNRKICLYIGTSTLYLQTWVDDTRTGFLQLNDPGRVKLQSIAKTLSSAQPPEYIKEAFGTSETFQAIIGADKVTACMLTLPPKAPDGRSDFLISDYIPGPEKELPANLVSKLRGVLSNAADMYDDQYEELPGNGDGSVLVFRFTFHVPNRNICLYFYPQMKSLNTWVDKMVAGHLTVNRPAILPLRAIAKRLFPMEPSL